VNGCRCVIAGSFQGWVAGTVTAAPYNPHGCDVPGTCFTRTTMIGALLISRGRRNTHASIHHSRNSQRLPAPATKFHWVYSGRIGNSRQWSLVLTPTSAIKETR
jgi:hypothetical protein